MENDIFFKNLGKITTATKLPKMITLHLEKNYSDMIFSK